MARLDVSVGINNDAFRRGLDEMRAGASRFKSDLSGMLSGAIGFGGIIAAAKGALEYADKVDDLAKRFKVGTDELQRLGLAADRNGSSFEAAAGGLNKLAIATSKALRGDEDLIQAFDELGVSIDDLLGKSPYQIMEMIGRSSMEAEPMVKVLGKTSLELRDALAAVSEEGEDFGEVMRQDVVEGLAAIQDKMERVSQSFKVNFGGVLVWLIGMLETTSAVFQGMVAIMVTGATSAGYAMGQALKGNFEGAMAYLKDFQKEAKAIITAMGDQEVRHGKKSDGKDDGKERRTFEDKDGAEDEEKAAQKREDRLKKIREAEADAAREALEGQQKINALIEERNRLLGEFKASPDTDEGIDALEKAQQLQRKIESEQKKQAEEKKRREDDLAKKKEEEAKDEADRLQRIDDALKSEFEAGEDDRISQLAGEDKIRALQEKRKRMQDEAAALEETDPEAAARKRTEIIGVDAEIRGERESLEDEQKTALEDKKKDAEDALSKAKDAKVAAASVPVDSLGAVGGGRGNFGGGDAVLRVAERQVSIQERILAQLQQMTGNANKKEADPWR